MILMQTYEVLTTPNLKELTKHGDSAFPLAIYVTTLSKNKLGYVQLHWHDEIQFVYVIKGCVKFEVEHNIYYVKENDGIFINSGCIHSASPYECEDSQYICIDVDNSLYQCASQNIINEKYLQPFLNINNTKTIILDNNIEWQKKILDQIIELSNLFEQKYFAFELLMQAKIIEMLYNLINHSRDKLNENIYFFNENQRIKDVLTYINKNYQNKITLDDLSKQANLCKSEFCRFFKKITNQTPFEYLVGYRINQSAILLRNSDYSILEISNNVGFNSVSYFVKKFKEQTNCTPKYYRNFYVKLIEK